MKTLDDLVAEGVSGRTVLVRADLNVPLDDSADERSSPTTAGSGPSLPTIRALRDAGARVVVMAHLGRPKRRARRREVLAGPGRGPARRAARHGGHPGEPRRRGHRGGWRAEPTAMSCCWRTSASTPRETSKDEAEREALAAELAALADVFVSDGFGVVHRKQASVYDVAAAAARATPGGLVRSEVEVLRKLPGRPRAARTWWSSAGRRCRTSSASSTTCSDSVDRLLIGGGMAYTFLAAQGHGVGDSLLEADQIDAASGYSRGAEKGIDCCPGRRRGRRRVPGRGERRARCRSPDEIPDGWMGLDIGPESIAAVRRRCSPTPGRCSGTARWACSSWRRSPTGTRGVAQAIVDAPRRARSRVVGGGDSAAAVRRSACEDGFSHISTGGGASPGVPRGQDAPRSRRPGGADDDGTASRSSRATGR